MEHDSDTAAASRSAYLDAATTLPSFRSVQPAARKAAPMQGAGNRAVLYLRVSSAGQVKTDYDPEGISIPAQRVACERKAGQLDLEIVDEYVEPGRSGTEMTKRIAFQELLDRIRRTRDVDYVIVYELSRLARNRIDDAIVMADLRKRGVTLISATESVDDTPVGQLMHGILAAFNEYRSAKDGADIAYKMGEKAKKGGTLGIAPIGYLNTIDRREGREIRSVSVDPDRAPFVKRAFELYADGDATIESIVEELNDRGLTTRPTQARAAGPISKSKVAAMLKDPYYLGLVKYKGQTFDGRHEPLISQELFDRVQDLLEARGYAGERRRRNHHYLKGSLFCGRCFGERDEIRRMIVQRATGRHGGEYRYYFCRGVQSHICDAPYSNLDLVEAAVEEHYATIRFHPDFIKSLRKAMKQTLLDSTNVSRLLRADIAKQLKTLDTKEDNLLDFAASGTLAADKINQRLRDIERQRAKLTEQLDGIVDELPGAEQFMDVCLRLLEDPGKLYETASDETRRRLNQAIFTHLFVYNEKVTDSAVISPLAELLAADAGFRALRATNSESTAVSALEATLDKLQPNKRAAGIASDGSLALAKDLYLAVRSSDDCSKHSVVREGGLEPPRPKTMAPKAITYANFVTRALPFRLPPPVRRMLSEVCPSFRINEGVSMHTQDDFTRVRRLIDAGLNDCAISRQTGIPRRTVCDWRRGKSAVMPRSTCRYHDYSVLPSDAYSYLLGCTWATATSTVPAPCSDYG